MDDRDILERIDRLVADEHELRNALADGGGAAARKRLDEIEVTLDQCWDLLRQRRARREFGEDPAVAGGRPPAVVENYEQ